MRGLLRTFGFPLLVVLDLAGSAYLVASVRVPTTVPDYALRAAAVYRLEVGAACFVVLYLAAMAFFLALDGRGFIELGGKGLRTEQIIRGAGDEQLVTLANQMKLIRNSGNNLLEMEAALHRAATHVEEQVQRLHELQKEDE